MSNRQTDANNCTPTERKEWTREDYEAHITKLEAAIANAAAMDSLLDGLAGMSSAFFANRLVAAQESITRLEGRVGQLQGSLASKEQTIAKLDTRLKALESEAAQRRMAKQAKKVSA